MRGKKLLSLVLSIAMTLSMFSGLSMTSAQAAVGDVANNVWTASDADAGKLAGDILVDDDKGTLTTLFDFTLTTELTDDAGVTTPVSETVGDRTFNAYVSHPSMNGSLSSDGTLNEKTTILSYVPKADGVLTAYFRNVGSTDPNANKKYICIIAAGTPNYKTGGSIVWTAGEGVSTCVSAQLEANKTYYIFVDGSKGQFMAIDFEVGATYEQPTLAPSTPAPPAPTIDPNAKIYTWAASANDVGKKAGDLLMTGLSLVSDNSSTDSKYVTAETDGKLEGGVPSGSALIFVAPENGTISVRFHQLGNLNSIKTAYIYDATAGKEVISYTTQGENKETFDLSVAVAEGSTYYIYAAGTKARYSAATFTPGAAPKDYSWKVSESDIGKVADTALMEGLTLVSDNSSESDKYITAADNGKITKDEEGVVSVTGAALKFVAPEDGKLEVTMIDVGSENEDGSIKVVNPVIYDYESGNDLFSYENAEAKETVNLFANVEAGKTYYIIATGTKGRFSAAKFTPASEITATEAPDVTTAPVDGAIAYADGTVTVTLADVESAVLINASYADGVLSAVATYPLTFTDGVATQAVEAAEGSKLMVWDSLKGMKPLCSAYTVSASKPDVTTVPDVTDTPATGTPATMNPDVTTSPNANLPVTQPNDIPEVAEVNVLTVDAAQTTNADNKVFKTVTEALTFAKSMNSHASESDRIEISIVPGTYREQLQIDVPYLTMRKAEGTEGNVLLTWYYGIGYQYYSTGSNGYYSKEAYEANKAAGTVANVGVDRWGCSTRLSANDFYAKDIIFENSFNRYVTEEEIEDGVKPAPVGGVYSDTGNKPERTLSSNVYGGEFTERAAAMAIEKVDRAAFYNCQFLSSQDTLYTGSGTGRVYFKDCVVEGQTDYIFGGSTLVFDNCDLNWAGYANNAKGGHVTASSNSSSDKGYLFYGGRVSVASTSDGQFVQGDFGRPWGGKNSPTAAIGVQINNLPDGTPAINAKGWSDWSTSAKDSKYYEYGTIDADGNKIDLTNRNTNVLDEWDVLAFNPYSYLIRENDSWDPMNVKGIWEPVIAKLADVVIADSETITKKADDTYEVSGVFTLPTVFEGYDVYFKSNSDYLTINDDNTVTVVRPISGTSEATLTAYIRKADDKYVGASKTINVTITADSSVDPAVFTASMESAKSAIAEAMGTATDNVYTLDRTAQIPEIAEADGVITTITMAATGNVNADGTISRNPYATDAATGTVSYTIECRKGVTLLRDTVTYDVTIPSKKGDLLYADFEDAATAVGGNLVEGGNNSGYSVNGAVSANLAKASSVSPVTVEFDVKKADTTVTLGAYSKTVNATDMADGWNTIKLVVDTAAKTITTSVNGTQLGEAETVAAGTDSVSSFALTNGEYDNIIVYEGVNNADGSKVYTTFWKASADDKGKPEGAVLMRGMTLMAEANSCNSTSATIDGEEFTYYVSNGSANGGWTNGVAKAGGIGFQFVAPADGTWTVYLTDLGSNKTFYIGSPDEEKTASGADGKQHSLTIDVKGGKTYYATVAGSKGRFVGAKYVPTTEGMDKYNPEVQVTEYTTTWYFGKSNGAPEYNAEGASSSIIEIEGENNAETTQTMYVDATAGKFNNATRTDDLAQVNDGTKFTFPVVAGSVITFGAYNAAGTLTINGTAFTNAESYTVPEGVTSVTATAAGVGYMSYIRTVTPAANGKPSDDAEPDGDVEATAYKTTWAFAKDGGATDYNLQGTGATADIVGTTVAVPEGSTGEIPENQTLTVDATSGKFNNSGDRTERCQVNEGTKFILPLVNGSVINFTSTNKNAEVFRIGTKSFSAGENYTYNGVGGNVEVLVKTGGYLSGVSVTSPVEPEEFDPSTVIPDYIATFEMGSDVTGILPTDEIIVEEGNTMTFPANHSMYKEGYTFKGWSDGTTTYAGGDTLALTAHTTYTAVFEENTKTPVETYTVKWEFNTQTGFPGITWQGKDGIFVAQATIDGEVQDIKLDVVTTGGGKFYVREKDAQTNADTKFVVPAVVGSVITFEANGDSTTYTVGATTINRANGSTAPMSYTVTADDITDGTVTLTNVGGGYTSYVQVTYPVAAVTE